MTKLITKWSNSVYCNCSAIGTNTWICITIRSYLSTTQAPLHSHWLATRRVTGHRRRRIHWQKMLEILGHPQFNQLHGHKILMNTTNWPDGLDLYIFSSILSYHPFVSVHDIQQKGLLNKISVYEFTHTDGYHQLPSWRFSSCPSGHATQ